MPAVTVARPVRSGDLLLRAFTAADAPQISAARTDPDIELWNPMRKPSEQWCLDRADWSDGTHASWAAVRPDRPEVVIGAVSLHQIDHDQLDAEVGFFVVPGHRRQGVAAACLETATRFAFDELGLRRTHLFHAVENLGSCAVATGRGARTCSTRSRTWVPAPSRPGAGTGSRALTASRSAAATACGTTSTATVASPPIRLRRCSVSVTVVINGDDHLS